MSSLLTSVVRCDGYTYTVDIDTYTEDTLIDAKDIFEKARQRGVLEGEFGGHTWTLLDESKAFATLDLRIDELHYARTGQSMLGCTLAEYKTTMRIVLLSYLGSSIGYLQGLARAMCRLANDLTADGCRTLPADYERPIQKFIELLPGESEFRAYLLDDLDDIIYDRAKQQKEKASQKTRARALAYYRSYLRFDRVMTDFWATASVVDKLLFFPLYFWWVLTGILPLRPSEFTLVPRDCIRWIRGKAHLTVRRTKVKGKHLGCRYKIKDDYCKDTYIIPEKLARDIEAYIAETNDSYCSDIDNLFCRTTQQQLLGLGCERKKYLYDDLSLLLREFYRRVVLSPKYGYVLRGRGPEPLDDGEIEKICLGDTRHIAMISLQLTGKSELISQSLSGHTIIDTGYDYYGHVRTFLDAVVMERVRPAVNESAYEVSRLPDVYTDVGDGICRSEKVHRGDFSDCVNAVSPNGVIGDCRSCSYYCVPVGKQIKPVVHAQDDSQLRLAFVRVIDSVIKARQGLGFMEDVTSASEQLQAEARHYIAQNSLALEEVCIHEQ